MGEKVRCINNADAGGMKACGYNSPLLEIGREYTLTGRETHSWYTLFSLAEFPGKQFNSVDFCAVS